MLRWLPAVWRVAATLLHLLHGVAVVALSWRWRDAASRQRRIAWWARGLLFRLGLRLQVQGLAAPGAVLVVSNHVSWLDILAIHAVLPRARFVAKSDVRQWPVLGWLIAAVDTLFIERRHKRDAVRVLHSMAQALAQGQTVAVFPEGTTGDGPVPLPFHANLLQSALTSGVPIQAVVLRYSEPGRGFSRTAAWIGDDSLGGSIWGLALARGLCVHLTLLPLIDPAGMDRRSLARQLQQRLAAVLSEVVP